LFQSSFNPRLTWGGEANRLYQPIYRPQTDDTLRRNRGASRPNFWKKWLLQPESAHSSRTGGYPFEETPAGAFLSERI